MEKEENVKNYLTVGQKISNREKIIFGLGSFGTTILIGIFVLYITYYYINILKLNYELFIIANIIYLIYNALNDVIFGSVGDKTRTKLGRRIPYIRYGAPIFAISFIFFWFPFPGYNDANYGQTILFLQLLIGYLFFDTMFTIVVLSLAALPPEITESTKERTGIAVSSLVFNLIGFITISVVPIIMSLGLHVFRIFIVIIAVVAMCMYFIVSYGIKERPELYKKDKNEGINIFKDIKLAFKNRAFISFLIFNFSVVFITSLMIGFAPFFTNIFGTDIINTTYILIAIFLGYFSAIPLFLYFVRKIEIRTLILLISIVCLIGTAILFIIDLIFNIVAVYWIIFFLNGILLGLVILYFPFISDAIDKDELTTGRRREGLHLGLNALITKPAEQLPAIIGTFILAITGYIPTETLISQPSSAILGFKFMIAVIPMIFAICLILSQVINPLKGKNLKELKEKIIKLHEEKENN